jgi:GNAT superfamily N-acetyltransferase
MNPSDFLLDGYRLEPHGEGVEAKGERWADETIADINALQNTFLVLNERDASLRPASWTRAYVENRNQADALGMALVRDSGGAAVGAVWMHGTRAHNRHVMFADISVLPDYRRRRVATALLAHFVCFARADGRTTLILGSDDTGVEAQAFAASLRAAVGQQSHANRLQLTDLPAGLLDDWLAEPAARGTTDLYELECLDGPTPDRAIEDVVALRGILLNTAPADDIPIDERVVTEADVRADDERTAASGDVRWLLFAREKATGKAVAYTEVFVSDERPRQVAQGATAVDPAHRGHGLGRWLKAALLQRVIHERPHTAYVQTFNADSNEHMLAINHAMGFKPHTTAMRWILSTDDAEAWLENRL